MIAITDSGYSTTSKQHSKDHQFSSFNSSSSLIPASTENIGGWTEVHSKKTQQKIKALSRQSSANRLFSANFSTFDSKQTLDTRKLKNSPKKITEPSIIQKSYSQAISQDDKSSLTSSTLPKRDFKQNTSRPLNTIPVESKKNDFNTEFLNQSWNFSFDILSRAAHELQSIALLLKSKEKISALFDVISPLMDMAERMTNSNSQELFEDEDLPSINPLLGASFDNTSYENLYKIDEHLKRPVTWASSTITAMDVKMQRFLSPPLNRLPATSMDLERKQATRELRQSLLDDKTEKLKSKIEKIRTVKDNQTKHLDQLKKSITEKQKNAERKRSNYLASLKTRKPDVIHSETPEKIETEISRLCSPTEENENILTCQKKQEAAMERRKIKEAQRISYWAKEDEKRKDMEAKKELERQKKDADKVAYKEEKQRRMKEFKSIKEIEEAVFRQELKDKLEMGSKRKEEQMKYVREKAAAANEQARIRASQVNASRRTLDKSKICLVCNVEFNPDENNLLHEGHEQYQRGSSPSPIPFARFDEAIPCQRSPATKKRIKRTRQKLRDLSKDYIYNESVPSKKRTIIKGVGERISPILTEIYNSRVYPENCSFLERELSSICRILENEDEDNMIHFCSLNLMNIVIHACVTVDSMGRPALPLSTINLAVRAVYLSCTLQSNAEYLLCHPDILVIELVETLSRIMNYCNPGADLCLLVSATIMKIVAMCIKPDSILDSPSIVYIKETIVGYILEIDFIQKIRNFFVAVYGPVDSNSPVLDFLMESMSLLQAVTLPRLRGYVIEPVYNIKSKLTTTFNYDVLVNTLETTDLVSIVTMLDALLLHKGGPTKIAAEEKLDDVMISISLVGIKTLNQIANINLKMMQSILNSEGMKPQLFHLVVFWLHYWGTWSVNLGKEGQSTESIDSVLHEIILLIGYVCLNDERGREILRFGEGPVILKVLANLPFEYFVDAKYQNILFPTLVSALYQDELNQQILEEDVSLELIMSFLSCNQWADCKDLSEYFMPENRIPEFMKESLSKIPFKYKPSQQFTTAAVVLTPIISFPQNPFDFSREIEYLKDYEQRINIHKKNTLERETRIQQREEAALEESRRKAPGLSESILQPTKLNSFVNMTNEKASLDFISSDKNISTGNNVLSSIATITTQSTLTATSPNVYGIGNSNSFSIQNGTLNAPNYSDNSNIYHRFQNIQISKPPVPPKPQKIHSSNPQNDISKYLQLGFKSEYISDILKTNANHGSDLLGQLYIHESKVLFENEPQKIPIYSKSFISLLEMGFSYNAIRTSLLQNNLNMEKALDYLMNETNGKE